MESVERKSLTRFPFSASTNFESGRLSSVFEASGVLQQHALQPDFTAHVLFTDEAMFTSEGVVKAHNFHVWATDNPHTTRPHAYQQQFFVIVWEDIIKDFLIEPYLLKKRLADRCYLIF